MASAISSEVISISVFERIVILGMRAREPLCLFDLDVDAFDQRHCAHALMDKLAILIVGRVERAMDTGEQRLFDLLARLDGRRRASAGQTIAVRCVVAMRSVEGAGHRYLRMHLVLFALHVVKCALASR